MMKNLPFILVLLCIAGLADSFLLTGIILFDSGRCFEGAGCQSVLSSRFAEVLGVSWSTLGVLHYFVLLVLSLSGAFGGVRGSLQLLRFASGIGVVVSLYLTYLQGVRIGSWCPLCLLSAFLQVAIFVLSWLALRRAKSTPRTSVTHLTWLGILSAVSLSLILWGLQTLETKIDNSSFSQEQDLFAEIDGEELRISEEEGLIQLRHDIAAFGHNHYESWYREYLFRRFAKENGFEGRAQLINARLEKEPITVTEEDVRKFYEDEYRSTAGIRLSLEETSSDIRAHLESSRFEEFELALLAEVEDHYKAEFKLPAPLPPKVDLVFSAELTPILGPVDAPVQIVQFVDFSCPYCRLTQLELQKLRKELGDQVAISYRHYQPVSEDYASRAARATYAAWQQGKFWPFTFELFEKQGYGIEKDETYLELARGHGLDIDRFNQDRASEASLAILERDEALVLEVNVPAPPTVFINGHRMTKNPTSENMLEKIKSLNLLP